MGGTAPADDDDPPSRGQGRRQPEDDRTGRVRSYAARSEALLAAASRRLCRRTVPPLRASRRGQAARRCPRRGCAASAARLARPRAGAVRSSSAASRRGEERRELTSRRVAAIAATTLAAATAAATGSSDAAQRTLYVAPNGSDKAGCTRTAPCRSFDAAYKRARPGDTVLVAGGRYPTQTVGVDPSKLRARADVVFRPAPGAIVRLADLAVYGSHLVFRGSRHPYNFRLRKLTSVATRGSATSHDVTFENLDGEDFNIGPNYDITIKGGDWGPSVACYARGSATNRRAWCPADSVYAHTGNAGSQGDWENHIGPDGTIPRQWPHHIVLDGLYIHDQNSLDLVHMHAGGLFLISGHEITIENSRFERNVVYQIQVQDFTSRACCGMTFGPPRNVVIQNNWFGPPVTGVNDPGGDTTDDNQPELQLDPRNGACWTNWLIRYNSFRRGPALGFDSVPCFHNVRVIGNIGAHPGLQCFYDTPGLMWAYNAWIGGHCGSTDTTLTSLPYVNQTIGHEDYHLTGGPAQDLVTGAGPDYVLRRDIDGDGRPRGPARDAGADER